MNLNAKLGLGFIIDPNVYVSIKSYNLDCSAKFTVDDGFCHVT